MYFMKLRLCNDFIWRCKSMCDKKDMDDLFEFLGFQEALKISQESKLDDYSFDIFKNDEYTKNEK